MKQIILIIGVVFAMTMSADAWNPDTMWTYKTIDGKELKMSVFLPGNYEVGKKFPTIVIFHGGSWAVGEASWQKGDAWLL